MSSEVRIRITPPHRWLDLNLAEVWRYKDLLYFFIWRDIKVRYKQTVIGIGWAFLQPFVTMLAFSLFFGKLAKISSEGIPYPLFYFTGLLVWLYFANALTSATNTLVDNQRVITKVYFPKILLPLAAVLSGLVDFGIGFAFLLILMLYYHAVPTPAALLLPLFLFLAIATAFSIGIWLAVFNAKYRDFRYATPFLVNLWMFVSPVAYPSSVIPENWRWLYGINPMAGVIEGFRQALTGTGLPTGPLFLVSLATVLLLLVGGVIYFQRMATTIADVV